MVPCVHKRICINPLPSPLLPLFFYVFHIIPPRAIHHLLHRAALLCLLCLPCHPVILRWPSLTPPAPALPTCERLPPSHHRLRYMVRWVFSLGCFDWLCGCCSDCGLVVVFLPCASHRGGAVLSPFSTHSPWRSAAGLLLDFVQAYGLHSGGEGASGLVTSAMVTSARSHAP
jgi:hypothetical protein